MAVAFGDAFAVVVGLAVGLGEAVGSPWVPGTGVSSFFGTGVSCSTVSGATSGALAQALPAGVSAVASEGL